MKPFHLSVLCGNTLYTIVYFKSLPDNRQTSGESASLPQYDEGTESAGVATSALPE